MKPNEQLALWLEGESMHDHDFDGVEGGQCCPDFSCCHPRMKWPKETRELFVDAFFKGDDITTMNMIDGASKNLTDKDVKVIDDE